MRNLNRTAAAALLLAAAVFSAAAQSGDQTVSAVNRIDWLQKTVTSTITLDARAAGIILPDGREAVSRKMTASIPELAGRPVFSLPVDSATTLGDAVRDGSVTLAQILRFLDEGEKTAPWFSPDLETCTMTSTVRLTDLQRMFIRHQNVWQPRRPLERVPTRTYSGIVIDARGQLPVHGEFTTDRLSPSLFPKIWDTGMTLAYERNMVEPETAAQNGILAYAAGPEDETCGERTGPDPLYIRAAGVYGIHRTDPVIARRDYLRIFCDEGNLELLKQGKVVILCDREMLQTGLTPRVPDNSFYFLRRGIKTVSGKLHPHWRPLPQTPAFWWKATPLRSDGLRGNARFPISGRKRSHAGWKKRALPGNGLPRTATAGHARLPATAPKKDARKTGGWKSPSCCRNNFQFFSIFCFQKLKKPV